MALCTCQLIAGAVLLTLISGSHGNQRQFGYFNGSSNAVIPNSIWDLGGWMQISFRTCNSSGEIIHQEDTSGDLLQIKLHNGSLEFHWRYNSVSNSVSIGNYLNNNTWYTCDLKYYLGSIHFSVSTTTTLYSKVVANSSHFSYLLDVRLSGSNLVIGSGFTGCLFSGVGVNLSHSELHSTRVTWDSCSLINQSGCDTGDVDGDDCSSYPCVQGRCIDGYKNFTCECPHNYNGTLCENDLSLLGCDVDNLCLNGGTCERLEGQSSNYECHCLPGYTGSTCETEIDECRQRPCSHGTCIDLVNDFQCNCTGSGYQGLTCSEDVNECLGTPNRCGNGSCVNNPGSFSCDCPVGFEGVGCLADVDECLSNPCGQNGTCTSGVNDFTCTCPPGYRGKQCEVDVNECESLNVTCPGENTQCVDQVNGYRCECKDGYAGLAPICRDIDECALNPCGYGATCHNLENDFFCDCPAGYNGTRCEIDEDECDPNPCDNGGTCEDGVNTYTCRCVPGFEGQNCTENIQECETLHVECRNGATCKDGINTFECECGDGWTGSLCDVDVDDCASNPCANGATCHNFNNYYNCNCLTGFTGFNCSTNIDDCQPNPCRNDGSCIDGVDDYNCSCTTLWMGKNCTESYDACIDRQPCQNEGTCYSEPPDHTYNCTCLPGFNGVNCEINIDDCQNNNCESYQECIDGIQNYTCGCPRGFSGPTCNTPVNECDTNPCDNGGTCHDLLGDYMCDCPQSLVNLTIYTPGRTNEFLSGWDGKDCDVDINECNASVPACLNGGICENGEGAYTCYCKNSDDLNLGRNCESVSSYCKMEELTQGAPPCMNGGTCVDGATARSIDCICAPGYSGDRCDEDIDDCETNPCQQNGTCYDGINSYNCSCVPGFTGTNCERNINECWPYNPCLNYGACIDGVNSYECNCTDTGFTGEQCQNNIDDCVSVSCQHGGTCVDGIKEYACACYPGYTGQDCETDIDECLSSPCQYNGTCIERSKSEFYPVYEQLTDFSYETASGYACICIPGITGNDCEVNIDDCENHPCENGATCTDLINAFKCDCAPGYEGQYCGIDIDECDLYGACRNGATCQDMVNDYSCHCPPFQRDTVTYGGKNCTVELVGCQTSSVLCQNGATCIPELENEQLNRHGYSCLCPPGFTGRYCNISTTVSFANGAHIVKQNVQNFEIEFRFRTTLKSAVLMAFQPRQGVYISVEIIDEHLFASFGDETTAVKSRRVKTRSKVNDAEMHTVYVMIISNITLRLESSMCNSREECTISFAFPQTFIPSAPKLFLGNTDQNVFPSTYSYSAFTGCMEDIIYNSSDYLMPSLPASAQYQGVIEGCDRREQCLPYTCNRHGDCLDLWNQFRCDCHRPYLGQTCGEEYTPATFFKDNVQSWASFLIPQNLKGQIQNNTKLSLFIRTRQSNGLIMYFGNEVTNVNSITFVTLEIKNGKLSATFKFCNAENVIESTGNYNDGEAHFIQLDVMSSNVSMSINTNTNDNQFHETKRTSDVRCLFHGNIAYFGGKFPDALVTNSRRRRRSTFSNDNYFKGIIQDVQVSGIKLQFYPVNTSVGDSLNMTSSTNLTEGQNSTEKACDAMPCQQNGTCTDIFYNDFVCECPYGYRGKDCSELDFCRNASCPDGSTCQSLHNGYECISSAVFNGNDNLVSYQSNLDPSTSIDTIDVKLRTEVMYGTLLFIEREQYFLKLRIAGGQVQLNYKLKDEISRQLNVLYEVNDGVLYDVALTTTGNTISIQIKDNATILKEASVTIDSPTTNLTELIQNGAKIYLGGTGVPRSQRSWEQPYKGCLEEVRLAGYLLPFYRDSSFANNNMRSEYFLVSNIYNVQHGCTYNTPRPVVPGIGRNDGTCHQMLNGDYVCSCLPGFTGPLCEVNIDDCTLGICENGGICMDRVEAFVCKCRKGYRGSRCQDDQNFCNGTVCNNNGSCQENETGFECNCVPDFTGITCDTTLNQSCTTGLCQNGGTCNDINRTLSGQEVSSFNCTCLAGYEGPLCERPIDYCLDLPCGANGNCTSLPGSQTYTCACDPGFTGTNCETNINNCANVCQNGGTCSDLVNDYNCTCPEGWTGRTCTEDVNECDLYICLRGTCQNTDGSYNCNCENTGYDGPNCDDQVNECETIAPCQNGGSCTDTEGSYNCNCTLGYEGQNCHIPDCDAGQCQNGATCQVNVDIWECDCVEYYEGTQCEIEGPCLNQTCNITNTDQCIQDIDYSNYTCSCKTGWQGDNCEENIDECSDGNNGGCRNGATCLDTEGSYECECVAGYTGRHCETNIDDCAGENPCKNEGNCIDLVNNYTCNCAGTGYEGDTCTIDIDECETGAADCPANTECKNTEGSYNCPCKQGFIGEKCVKDPCLETICEHDGSCNSSAIEGGDYTATCFCKEGYEGSRCEKIGAPPDSGINIWYIIGPVIAVVLLIIIIGIVIFVMMARTKRATRGTYSPSRQETSGARVELGNVLKKPPEERLI